MDARAERPLEEVLVEQFGELVEVLAEARAGLLGVQQPHRSTNPRKPRVKADPREFMTRFCLG